MRKTLSEMNVKDDTQGGDAEVKCLLYNSMDQKALEYFVKEMYEYRGYSFDPTGLHSDIRQVDKAYFSTGGQFWVIKEQDNRIIGTIALKITDKEKGICEIKRFFVLPENQGHGKGKLLMGTAIDYARSINLKKVRLDTMKSSIVARAIFRKFGFLEIPQYNDNDIAELFYELKINQV